MGNFSSVNGLINKPGLPSSCNSGLYSGGETSFSACPVELMRHQWLQTTQVTGRLPSEMPPVASGVSPWRRTPRLWRRQGWTKGKPEPASESFGDNSPHKSKVHRGLLAIPSTPRCCRRFHSLTVFGFCISSSSDSTLPVCSHYDCFMWLPACVRRGQRKRVYELTRTRQATVGSVPSRHLHALTPLAF